MKKKVQFPYDYKTVPLKNGKGTATITGNPTPELMSAINALADAAFNKKLNSEQKVKECDASKVQETNKS